MAEILFSLTTDRAISENAFIWTDGYPLIFLSYFRRNLSYENPLSLGFVVSC